MSEPPQDPAYQQRINAVMAELQAAKANSCTELQHEFHGAQLADEPLDQSKSSSSTKMPDRPTSYAKTLDEGYQEQFQSQKAANPVEQGRGSEMVEKDQPKPELKPQGDFAKAADAEAFNKAWENEATNVKSDRVAKVAAELKASQVQDTPGQQNDRGPGMG